MTPLENNVLIHLGPTISAFDKLRSFFVKYPERLDSLAWILQDLTPAEKADLLAILSDEPSPNETQTNSTALPKGLHAVTADQLIAFSPEGLTLLDGKSGQLNGEKADQNLALHWSKGQLHQIMENVISNTHDAVMITEAEPFEEPGPRIIFVNKAFCDMTGYTAEEVIGKSPRLMQGPKSDKEALRRLGNSLRNWQPAQATTINYKKNGEEFWINFSVSPVKDQSGWYTHWVAIERDVTIEKYKEIGKQLTVEITRFFAENDDLNQILQEVLANIHSLGDFPHTEAWLVRRDETGIDLVAFFADRALGDWAPPFSSLAYGEALPGMVWKQREILAWDVNEEHIPLERRAASLQIGVKTLLGIPLLHNNDTVGVLLFGLNKPKDKLGHLQEIFKELKNNLGSEIIRKQWEHDLRVSNDRFERVAQATQDAIWDWDIQRSQLYWGQGFQTLFGYNIHEIRPDYAFWAGCVHPEDLGRVAFDLAEIRTWPHNYIRRMEYRFRKADGEYAYVVDKSILLRDAKGRAVRMIGAITDITLRREYEDVLLNLNQALQQHSEELAKTVDENAAYIRTIEAQNQKLREIAWIQSHIVRSPLVRILGLAKMLEAPSTSAIDQAQCLAWLLESVNQLDGHIREIVERAQAVEDDLGAFSDPTGPDGSGG